jgi:hypothetical protein
MIVVSVSGPDDIITDAGQRLAYPTPCVQQGFYHAGAMISGSTRSSPTALRT